MQKLLATLWTFEPQIEAIHPIHRRENAAFCPGLREGTVCGFQAHLRGDRNWMDEHGTIDPGLAEEELCNDERAAYLNKEGVSLLAGGLGSKECDERAGLEALLDARSTAKLKYLLRTHDRSATWNGSFKCAYHVGDVEAAVAADMPEEYGMEVKRTVEFRQHQSTIDFERLKHWIGFCVGVVRFAEAVDGEVLRPWLRRALDEERGLDSVPKAMGLHEAAEYYRARIVEDRMVNVPISKLPKLEQCLGRLREEREGEA